MNHQTFTGDRSGNKIRQTERWLEGIWILILLLAALLLLLINLDSLPLPDGGKTVTQIAEQIPRTSEKSSQWFYPATDVTTNLVQFPLPHWLITAVYQIGGSNLWMARLPGALLTALSVPLLYGIGREIFPSRQTAIFSSLIYLTLLPVIHHGRLALTDGTVLCLLVLMMWCVLRSRRDLRWSCGIGIGLGLICLTKGLLLGLFLLTIALLFLGWDTPRLLTSVYWWSGLLLGIAPTTAWYVVRLLELGLLPKEVFNQLQGLLWASVETNPINFPWYNLMLREIFAVPWILFWPYGLQLAWKNYNWGWARLVLVWTGFYLGAVALYLGLIAVIFNKLPGDFGYFLPIYPALALAGGSLLTEVWNWPSHKTFPRFWSIGLSLMAIAASILSVHFSRLDLVNWSLALFFASVALTMTIAAVLIARRNLQFIMILFWGSYLSLLLFVTSPYWI
ncbi:MAG: glycosyltransferase family 39 protein [Symploca sp. SIO3E6]|nr:glycosyltransferase family 39 protein [Caldora sp. SIO3E6]